MATAKRWRITSLTTVAGGDLTLSRLMLGMDGAPVAGTPVISSSVPPASGALVNLLDDSASTCTFAAQDVRAPGFWIELEFASAVNVSQVGFGAVNQAAFAREYQLFAMDTAPAQSVISVFSRAGIIYPGNSQLQWCDGVFSVQPAAQTALAAAALRFWRQCAVGSNGMHMVAGVNPGLLYVSHDGGASWSSGNSNAFPDKWYGCGISADGRTVLGVSYDASGVIARSVDGGATFTALSPSGGFWLGAHVSGGGSVMCVGSNTSGSRAKGVWISTDGGTSWAARPNAAMTGSFTSGCACDDSGQRVVVTDYQGYAYLSTDSGQTWSPITALGVYGWTGAGMSASGRIITLSRTNNTSLISTDYGATWAPVPGFPGLGLQWDGVDISHDESTILGATVGNYLYALGRAGVGVERRALRVIAPVQIVSIDLQDAGNGRIVGTVKKKSDPVDLPLHRRVRLHEEVSGRFIRETWSDAATGAYEFANINASARYYACAFDYAGRYQGVIATGLTPRVGDA